MNKSSVTEEENIQILHLSLKHIAKEMGRTELNISFEELSIACNVSVKVLQSKFYAIETLLVESIHRMQTLFIKDVKNKVFTCKFHGRKKAIYFLDCVKDYFSKYPEAGYLFTMSFLRDIIVSDIYNDLEVFFSLWKETLLHCLHMITTVSIAQRITDMYLISLLGRLQISDISEVLINNAHTEYFLSHIVNNL